MTGAGQACDDEIARFYIAHQQPLLRFLVRGCQCPPHEAEDIIQVTIMVIRERHWAKIRAYQKPVTWWYMLARQEFLRRRRRWAREQFADDLPEPLRDPADPHDHFALLDSLKIVSDLIRELPEMQRQVMWLRTIQDLSEAETARILGVTAGTAKRHLHHARKNLAVKLCGETGLGGDGSA